MRQREQTSRNLGLLANIVRIFQRADDANQQSCNQALFKAIYIDEDNDVRTAIGPRTTG